MAILQPITNIAEICAQHGITEAVLSPGSRCAPLTLAFVKHPNINARTISDERSAAFIGLGIAQHNKQPTVLVCTSGSATYNYSPAVAEAYYQQAPLLILTADRPPEWIDQYDGQTIRQEGIYGKHVKASYAIPTDTHPDATWQLYRTINEAINLCKSYPTGPVHINIPLREPFYPEVHETVSFEADVGYFDEVSPNFELKEDEVNNLLEEFKTFQKIVIVGGQSCVNEEIQSILQKILSKQHIPVLGDIISNLHAIDGLIKHHDLFLNEKQDSHFESLCPALLITFGKSVISKNLKLFLRKYKPNAHWHIQPHGAVADTFQSLTKIIRSDIGYFLYNIVLKQYNTAFNFQKQQNYYELWQIEERKIKRKIEQFFPYKSWCELNAYYEILKQLPENYQLHLANSLAVRYANYIGISQPKTEVFANRGTSGIDGSNSTAVGYALASGKNTLLLTGDMAFFYDRNAFWNNYNYDNLKIVVFNNNGGGIFNMIEGPSLQDEYKEYFETDQRLTAKNLAKELGYEYLSCDKPVKLINTVKAFYEATGTTVFEIFTDSQANKSALKQMIG